MLVQRTTSQNEVCIDLTDPDFIVGFSARRTSSGWGKTCRHLCDAADTGGGHEAGQDLAWTWDI